MLQAFMEAAVGKDRIATVRRDLAAFQVMVQERADRDTRVGNEFRKELIDEAQLYR